MPPHGCGNRPRKHLEARPGPAPGNGGFRSRRPARVGPNPEVPPPAAASPQVRGSCDSCTETSGAVLVRRGTGSGEVPLPRPPPTGCPLPQCLRARPLIPGAGAPARTAAPLTCSRRARPAPPRHRRARPAGGRSKGRGLPRAAGGAGPRRDYKDRRAPSATASFALRRLGAVHCGACSSVCGGVVLRGAAAP